MKQTILFLAANPLGTERLALDQECNAIEDELRRTSARDAFELRSKWVVGVDELMRHLNQLEPTIVHFSGHGRSGTAQPVATGGPRRDIVDLDVGHGCNTPHGAGILLQEGTGAQFVSERALAEMIATAAPSTRIVVLNACYSAAIAESLRHKVDCVIGMDGAIGDDAARSFSVAFYRALGYGRSVGNAFAQARASLAGKQMADELLVCRTRDGVDAEQLTLLKPVPPSGASTTITSSGNISVDRGAAFDLFLAYPCANKGSARALYELLQPDVLMFLDRQSLPSGAQWPREAPAAQQASRATLLLVSPHSDAAWYLGDEVITAMELHRDAPQAHRLVLVVFARGLAIPHGLRHVPAIDVTSAGGLDGVAAQLREHVAQMRRHPLTPPSAPPRNGSRPAGDGSRCDHFRLHRRLGQLNDSAFEQILGHAGVDRASVGPRTAPFAERVLDVAQLAALEQTLCHRLSAELDRHAPWTRR